MKLLIFLSLISLSVSASPKNDLVGEWEEYNNSIIEQKYTYFRLNPNMSGVYATVRADKEQHIDYFTSANAKYNDGILEVTFSESSGYVGKLILSAYRSQEDETRGLATGSLYMYLIEDGEKRLFNTLFLRLLPVAKNSFSGQVNSLLESINATNKSINTDTQR